MNWSEVEAIGVCIGAVGTILAVITALWLANRTEKIKIKIESSVKEVFGDVFETVRKATDAPNQEEFIIICHNTTNIAITISQLFLYNDDKTFLLNRYIQHEDLNKTIDPKNQGVFSFPSYHLTLLAASFCGAPPEEVDLAKLKTIKIGCRTSTRKDFSTPLDKHVQKWILKNLH